MTLKLINNKNLSFAKKLILIILVLIGLNSQLFLPIYAEGETSENGYEVFYYDSIAQSSTSGTSGMQEIGNQKMHYNNYPSYYDADDPSTSYKYTSPVNGVGNNEVFYGYAMMLEKSDGQWTDKGGTSSPHDVNKGDKKYKSRTPVETKTSTKTTQMDASTSGTVTMTKTVEIYIGYDYRYKVLQITTEEAAADTQKAIDDMDHNAKNVEDETEGVTSDERGEGYEGIFKDAYDILKANGVEEPSWNWLHPIKSFFSYVTWVVVLIMVAISSVGQGIFAMDDNFNFTNSNVTAFVTFFQQISGIFLALGIILSISEEMVRYSNGGGQPASLATNIAKAIVYYLVYSQVITYFFNLSLQIASGIQAAILSNTSSLLVGSAATGGVLGGAAVALVKGLSTTFSTSPLASIFIIILIAYAFLKFVFLMAKRVPMFMALLAEGALMPVYVARGNNSALQSYLQKLLSFYLGIILQLTFFGLGISFMCANANFDLEHLFVGISLMLSVDEAMSWVGGLRSESDLDKMTHTMDHLGNMVKDIAGPGNSPDVNAAGALTNSLS